jgi:hypothetical protein
MKLNKTKKCILLSSVYPRYPVWNYQSEISSSDRVYTHMYVETAAQGIVMQMLLMISNCKLFYVAAP